MEIGSHAAVHLWATQLEAFNPPREPLSFEHIVRGTLTTLGADALELQGDHVTAAHIRTTRCLYSALGALVAAEERQGITAEDALVLCYISDCVRAQLNDKNAVAANNAAAAALTLAQTPNGAQRVRTFVQTLQERVSAP